MQAEQQSELKKLGQGRSAEVFADRDARGRAIVRKVFRGDRLSKAILFLLTGSANPYTWCEAAIRTAFARRQLLSLLVAFWFGKDRLTRRLRLPRTDGWGWNPEHHAFELRCELVDGCHLPLQGPEEDRGKTTSPGLMSDLVVGVMRPLQRHLAESGFDGLQWQAGRGNPVAGGNFMLERPAGAGRPPAWVWIDLESGVPALFALDPRATLGFYLPKSLRHGRWLFDDVDIDKLNGYLDEHSEHIEAALGRPAFEETLRLVEELEAAQDEWRAIPRSRRSIAYELSQGRITPAEAEHYGRHPWRWTLRLASVTVRRGAVKLVNLARRGLRWLRSLDPAKALASGWHFTVSQRFRGLVARRFVDRRITEWSRRRFLTTDQVRRLRRQLRHDEASSYLTDFIVHLMIKPLIKALQWFAVPSMLALGWLDVATAAVLLVAGGSLGRTLYTSGRFAQALRAGRRRPWVALLIGIFPVVGNAAYPAQLLYCGTEKTSALSRFILLDAAATIGRAVPIWGGADSLTEHACNRLGHIGIDWLQKAGRRNRQPERPLEASLSS